MKRKLGYILLLFFLVFKVNAQIDTVFYFAAPWITPDHDDKKPVKFHISSFSAPSTTVWIKQPASPLSMDTFFVMGPGQLVDVVYWRGAAVSPLNLSFDSLETRPANVVRTNGIRIRASRKITVVFDQVTTTPNNPETFSLKGQNGFGKEFICPFQTKWNNKNLGADRNGDGIITQPKQQINIVATQSNTIVWITPRCNIVGHAANITFSVMLPFEGATYTAENVTLQTNLAGQNLGGSVIVSNKPIAVTVADDSVNPGSGAGQTCYDLMGDQIVPVELVGTDYIVNRGQLNAQTGEAFFVVATENFTQVDIIGASGTSTLLNKGDTYVHNLNSDLSYIRATKNIYLLHASGYGCELGEALLPPLNCAGSDSVTFTRNNADAFFLNVLCKGPALNNFILTNTLTTGALSPAQFTVIPSTSTLQGGPFYGAQFGPYSTSVIPVNSSNLLFNTAGSNGFFALGIFNGTQTGGTLFHYMSSFLRRTIVKTTTVSSICAGSSGTVALTGTISGAALTGVWSTSYPSGSVTIQGGGSGNFSNYSSVIGTISTVYSVSAADTTFLSGPTKTITLYLTSTGLCKNVTDSVKLILYQRPIVSAGTNSILCKNNVLPLILTGSVTNANNGVWSGGNAGAFGIPGSVTSYTPSQADINSGQLTLTLTSVLPFPGCANASSTLGVTFINPANISVVPTVTQVCTNSTSLTLNGVISGITNSGQWSGGSGAYLPTNASPTTTYLLSQADLGLSSITLTLTSTNNSLCASESATMLINIIPKPELQLPQNIEPVCSSSGSIALSGTITGLAPTGIWLTSGTGSIVQGNPNNTITATYYLGALDVLTGSVSFVLQSQAGVCPSESASLSIEIVDPPLVEVTNNFIPVCNNASITLSGTVSGITNTGIWSTSSNTSSPGTFTPSATSLNGLYVPSVADIELGYVRLTLSSTGNGVCPPSTAAFTASFIPAPKADFVSFGKRCLGSTLTFSSTTKPVDNEALKYNWDFGDASGPSLVINPIKTFSNSGQYVVTLTVTGVNSQNVECPDIVKRNFIIKALPVASFSAPPACQDKAVVFINRSYSPPGADPIVRWEYYFGDRDTSANRLIKTNPSNVSHLYKIPGSYIAAISVTSGVQGSDPALGCISEPQFIKIDVLTKPKAEFGLTNNPAVVQEPIYFSDFSTPANNIKSWYWQFGDDAASSEQAPSHAYQYPGAYKLLLTITDLAGCQDTISKIIGINMLPQVPAAFSPNDDNVNDLLHVMGGPFQGLNFKVYNNWGQLLFETTDQKIGWDGKWNGTPQPNGVYVWTLIADMYNNRQVKLNGDVTIIR